MKPRITRPAPGRWQVERPTVGFTHATTTVDVYPSWHAAIRSLSGPPGGVGFTQAELSFQPHDGLSSVPSWDPTWPLNHTARRRP